MQTSTFVSENRLPAIFALAVMLLGTAAYFANGGGAGAMAKSDQSFYTSAKYKAGVTSDGLLKVFVLASNNALAMLPAAEGRPIPEQDTMVVGAAEASTMKGESLFSRPGDRLYGFFGIDTQIEGVLKKTGQPLDMFHFLSYGQFEKINGSPGIFALADKNDSEIFLAYNASLLPGLKLPVAEGSMGNFQAREIGGKRACPVAFGADEARMMREEKEFSGIGDRIAGFSGNDVVVAAVLEKTGTPLDIMHIVSADCRYS